MPIPRYLFFFLPHVLFHSYACVHSIASVTTNTKHRIYEAQVCDMCVCLFVSAWSCMYAVSIVYIIAYYRTTLTAANSFTQVLHRHFINSLSVESSRLVGFVFWTALVVSLSSGDCSTISHKTSNNDNNICIVCVLSVNPNNGTSVYKFNLYICTVIGVRSVGYERMFCNEAYGEILVKLWCEHEQWACSLKVVLVTLFSLLFVCNQKITKVNSSPINDEKKVCSNIYVSGLRSSNLAFENKSFLNIQS